MNVDLKIIKDVSISWSVKQKTQETKELVEIKILLVDSFKKPGFVFSHEVDKISLVELESRRRIILLVREQEARHKSRATCLLCGDDNTSFFHKFANHRKNINSIWKIEGDDGLSVEGFESIAMARVHHFENLF